MYVPNWIYNESRIDLDGFNAHSVQLRFRQVDLVGLGYALKCRLSSADNESIACRVSGALTELA